MLRNREDIEATQQVCTPSKQRADKHIWFTQKCRRIKPSIVRYTGDVPQSNSCWCCAITCNVVRELFLQLGSVAGSNDRSKTRSRFLKEFIVALSSGHKAKQTEHPTTEKGQCWVWRKHSEEFRSSKATYFPQELAVPEEWKEGSSDTVHLLPGGWKDIHPLNNNKVGKLVDVYVLIRST